MATKTLRTLFNILVVMQVILALAQAQSSDTTTDAASSDATTTVASTTDAASSDATTTVASTTDAASSDATTTVASTTDATTTVASTTDAASSDATTSVASTTDAASSDVTTTDATTTDAASSDATTTVASTTDAASTDATTTVASTTPVPDTSVDVKNSTNNIKDYESEARKQLASILATMKTQIDELSSAYARQISAIAHNGDLMEDQIKETNQKLYALAFLNDLSKFCVQKYSSQLIVTEVIHSAVLSCVTEAESSLASVLTSAQRTYNNLNALLSAGWQSGLDECERVNTNSSDSRCACVRNFVQGTIQYFNLNWRTFKSQIEGARCEADSRVRTATECVFETGTQATTSVGIVKRQIDDCISGVGVCTPCPKQPECQKVEIQASLVNSTLETILNPFKGVDPSKCITVTVTADIVN